MALKYESLKLLAAKTAGVKRGQTLEFSNQEFSADEANSLLRKELKELTSSPRAYRHNKNLVFDLIEETVDEVLPKKVYDALDQFVEIRTVANGDKVFFTKREGELRGRNFVTRVAHAGVYETFKLDRSTYDVGTEAHGAAVEIGIEEFLEGRADFAELIDIVTEGFEKAVYLEILRHMLALKSTTVLPANNIRSANGWDPRGFHALLGIARAYAEPTIFCSYMFAAEMIPHMTDKTEAQKNEIQSKGYIGSYMGAKIVVLPTSFFDNSNTAEQLTLPAGIAFIMPTGQEKPVKLVFEGETLTQEFQNRDWSKEIQMYKKFGAALLANPGICIYENTSLNAWPAVQGPIFVPAEGEVAADATYKYTRLV